MVVKNWAVLKVLMKNHALESIFLGAQTKKRFVLVVVIVVKKIG